MANFCNFDVTVKGDPQSLKSFEELVMRHKEPDYPNEDPGSRVVILLNLEEDDLGWINLERHKEIKHIDNGDLNLNGYCDSCPPVKWLVNVSKQIPGVSFLLNTTLEHEHFEEWSISNGNAERTYTETINIRAGEEWKPIPPGQNRMTPD